MVFSRKAEACGDMVQRLRADGDVALSAPAHIGRDEDNENLVRKCLQEFGRLDAVAASAAIDPVFADLETLDPASWQKVLDANLNGKWLLARHALPAMASYGGGAMVGAPRSAAYGDSKAGLNH